MAGLEDETITDLLVIHVAAMEELRRRNMLRSANNPTDDGVTPILRRCGDTP